MGTRTVDYSQWHFPARYGQAIANKPCQWWSSVSGIDLPLTGRLQFKKLSRMSYSSFHNNETFLRTVDSLPGPSASWKLFEISIEGTIANAQGLPTTEKLDLWARDPVEVIADLIGNPEFKTNMSFEPYEEVEVEESNIGDSEVDGDQYFEDIASAQWMWRVQVSSSRHSYTRTDTLPSNHYPSVLPLHR